MLTDIQGDERRPVAALVLQYLTMGVANTLMMSVAFAAFFERFGAAELTLVYLANGAVISGITGLFLQLTRRLSFPAALLALSGCLAAAIGMAGLLWLLLDGPSWLAFALPVIFQTLAVLNNLIIWSLAGRLFDVRQGRRFFGLINVSFWLGAIPTGLLLPLLVPVLGLLGLLLAASAVSWIAFAELLWITRVFVTNLGRQAGAKGAAREPIGTVLRDRYVQRLFFASVCGWLSFYAIDNIFYDLASRHFPEPDVFAGFMGLFMAIVGGVTITGGWFGSQRSINALGTLGALLVLPITLTLFAAGMGAVGLVPILAAAMFWLAAGARLFNSSMRGAVAVPALNLTFQPLPVARRATAQTLAEGVVQPVAIGIAGLALLLLRGVLGLDAGALTWVLAATSLLWALGSWRLGAAYREKLASALRSRLLDTSEPLVFEKADLRLIEERLTDARPAVVAYAVDVLERHAPARYMANLPSLLGHSDSGVRIDALARIERAHLPVIADIRGVAEFDSEPAVRSRAVHALALLSDSPEPLVRRALDGDDDALRAASVIGLLQRGELDGLIAAASQLEHRLNAPDPVARAWVARVLGESQLRGVDRSLRQLLQDDDPQVARAALAAASRVRSPLLWPDIVPLLGHRRLRRRAAAALAVGDETAAEVLAQARAEGSLDRAATLAVCAALAKLPGRVATSELMDLASVSDELVRGHALAGLVHRRDRQPLTMAADLETALRRETAMAAGLLDLAARMTAAQRTPLLDGAFAEAIERCRSRALLVLALHRDVAQVRRAATVLGISLGHSGRTTARAELAHQRALAIELIDELLPARIRGPVLALVEDLPNGECLNLLAEDMVFPAGDPVAQAIESWRVWGTDWLSACALHGISGSLAGERLAAVHAAAGQADSMIQETATRALGRVGRPGQEPDQEIATMLSTVERVILLKGSNFFAGLPEMLLGEIAVTLEELEVPPGTHIVEKGAVDSALYLVAAGEVGVFDGERQLATLGDGKLFGEMALLDPAERSATVAALGDTRLLRLDAAVFQDLLEDNHEMARAIIGELVRRLRGFANAG